MSWGQEDWRAENILAHSDQDWLEREAELDCWLGYAIVVISILGLWKALDLVIALVRYTLR